MSEFNVTRIRMCIQQGDEDETNRKICLMYSSDFYNYTSRSVKDNLKKLNVSFKRALKIWNDTVETLPNSLVNEAATQMLHLAQENSRTGMRMPL